MIVSVYDFVTGPNLKNKKNCKFMHNCDEKSITGKLTGPHQIFTGWRRGNRTSAKVADKHMIFILISMWKQ